MLCVAGPVAADGLCQPGIDGLGPRRLGFCQPGICGLGVCQPGIEAAVTCGSVGSRGVSSATVTAVATTWWMPAGAAERSSESPALVRVATAIPATSPSAVNT